MTEYEEEWADDPELFFLDEAVAPSERAEVLAAFNRAVNMSPAALKKWLDDPDSLTVGALPKGAGRVTSAGQGESVGHASGRRILLIKAKKRADLTDDDYAWMRKVIGFVARHSKMGPAGDPKDSRWRKSLMNWGHDPVR